MKDHEPVTVFTMEFKQPVPKGTAVDIKMTLNNNGLLSIVAEELLYHSKLETEYTVTGGMTEAEMKNAMARVENSRVE